MRAGVWETAAFHYAYTPHPQIPGRTLTVTSMDDPGALLEKIVAAQWDTVSRQAWAQYERRGRGAVVFKLQRPGRRGKEPLRYLTFKGAREEIEASAMATLYRLVASYDPRTEAVVAVVLPDGRTVFDVFSKTPHPASTAA